MNMTEKIEQVLKPEIESSGAEFVNLELRGKPGTYKLSLFVDSKPGISLGECRRISKKLIDLPELERLLGDKYRLEVSSPGTDRTLKNIEDLRRKIGIDLEVTFNDEQKEKRLKGKLVTVTNKFLCLKSSMGDVEIPFERVIKAVQVLPW